jgi:hypothetical protein
MQFCSFTYHLREGTGPRTKKSLCKHYRKGILGKMFLTMIMVMQYI